jgi:DNA-binding NarL/FixJ family response regulator
MKNSFSASAKEQKMEIIKVAIVDADTLVREGLKRILAREHDMLFVGEGVDELEMNELLERVSPDVLILDLQVFKRKTPYNPLGLKEVGIGTKVLILSPCPDQMSILDAAKAGARGYVYLQDVNPATITHAVRMVHRGEIWADRQLACSQAFVQFALQRYQPEISQGEGEITTVLSKRELEVISLLAEGLPNKKIAKKLFIEEGTVKMHVRRICQKLGVKNRTQAALLRV